MAATKQRRVKPTTAVIVIAAAFALGFALVALAANPQAIPDVLSASQI